jgi:hypothetical protein
MVDGRSSMGDVGLPRTLTRTRSMTSRAPWVFWGVDASRRASWAVRHARRGYSAQHVLTAISPPVIVLFFYAWRLPPFRTSQILGGLAVLLPMFVYLVRATSRAQLLLHCPLSSHRTPPTFIIPRNVSRLCRAHAPPQPLIWVTNRTAQIVIASLGIAVDIMRLDLIAYNLMGRWHLRRQAKEWAKSQPVGPAEHRPGVKWHNMPSMPEGFRIPGERDVRDVHEARGACDGQRPHRRASVNADGRSSHEHRACH